MTLTPSEQVIFDKKVQDVTQGMLNNKRALVAKFGGKKTGEIIQGRAVNMAKKEIDFIIPSKEQYIADKKKVIAISCKTSLRERWEQVVAEKDHIGLSEILLFTIGDDLKKKNNKRITERGIIIVTFPEIKKKYPKEKNVITFEDAFNKYIPKFIPKKK